MHIKQYRTRNKKTGKVYIKHQLVESYRTQKGPRHRVVMNLGKLKIPRSEWRKLAFALESRLAGQGTLIEDPHIVSEAERVLANYDFYRLRKKKEETGAHHLTIDLNRVATTANRSLGPELLAGYAWEILGMEKILKDAGITKKSAAIAKASIFARLIRPSSELAALKWIKDISSVPELTDGELSSLKKDPLYQAADILYYHKDKIEAGLRQKEEEIFPAKKTLFLYDLTNTYMEGAVRGNFLAGRAKSKDRRSDCPLICLALLVDSRGYPIFSQVYPGNTSEPLTLSQVLDRLQADSQRSLLSQKPTIVADRGIATKENISLLSERGYDYMVVERRRCEKDYTLEFSNLDDFKTRDDEDKETIFFKKIQYDGKARLLVASLERKEKEEAMDRLKEERFLEDAARLRASVAKRNVILAPKVQVRIGRILERYPTVAKYYNIEAVTDSGGKTVLDLKVEKNISKRQKRNTLTGCYVIETTHADMEDTEILRSYHSLTRIEDAFRSLKTELGIRPVFHQKGDRCAAHLFISVLAYHLLNTIELALSGKGEHKRWKAVYDMLGIKDPLGKVHLRL